MDQLPVFKYSAENEIEMAKDKSCIICMDTYKHNEEVMTLPCTHKVIPPLRQFHNNCIRKWLEESKVCPICKTEVKLQEVSINSQD